MLILLSTTTNRVSITTKGRNWQRTGVFCLFFCRALNARLHSCLLTLIPLNGMQRLRRTRGLPVVNACQRPILALHCSTSIPIGEFRSSTCSGFTNPIAHFLLLYTSTVAKLPISCVLSWLALGLYTLHKLLLSCMTSLFKECNNFLLPLIHLRNCGANVL